MDQDIFDNVTYTGFSFVDGSDGSGDQYQFTVTLAVRPPELETDEEAAAEEGVE